MNTKLIALAVIAAGTEAAITADIAEGAAFEVPADQAEKLLTAKLAKLADDPLANQSQPKAKLADDPLANQSQPKVKTVKVRLLQDCAYGKGNDVADIPASDLKQLKADGVVDDDKAAVAYAANLGKPGEA